ncbi:MAG: hypothetical protein EBR51_12870, partial [Gammaproteobacteria bacterium]|nr:hypothetical protein [Gammaproteobacteria bacterium]
PDGYTLLIMSNTQTVNESLIANKPFQLMRDFDPIAPINESDLVLVARTSLPATGLRDIIVSGRDPRFLVSEPVREIIRDTGCYARHGRSPR